MVTGEIRTRSAGRGRRRSWVLGIAATDDVVYVGNWDRVRSYQLFRDRKPPNIRLPESANLIDFGSVKPGEPVPRRHHRPMGRATSGVVGKTGRIEYIAREYDPEAIDAVIRRLLAEGAGDLCSLHAPHDHHPRPGPRDTFPHPGPIQSYGELGDLGVRLRDGQ